MTTNRTGRVRPTTTIDEQDWSPPIYKGTLFLNENFSITYVSPDFQTDPLIEPSLLLGQQASALLNEREYAYFLSELSSMIAHNGSVKEILLRHRYGEEWKTKTVRVTNMLSVPGVMAFVCQVFEVVNKVVLPTELLTSQNFYRSVFQHNPLPILICLQENFRIVNANDKASVLFGVSSQQLFTSCLQDYAYVANSGLLDVLEEKYRLHCHEKTQVVFKGAGGEKLYVEITVHGVKYKEQNAFLLMLNDITREKKLQTDLVKEQAGKQRVILKATVKAQEKLSQELSMEMHDNINPTLATVKLMLSHGLEHPGELKTIASKSIQWVENAMEEIRQLSKNLAPPVLKGSGLADAVTEIVESLRMVSKISISSNVDIANEDVLSEDLKICVFRIIREQVNNVIKYAACTRLTLELVQQNHMLSLCIADNGVGFDLSAKRTGIGINNIYNRSEMYDGKVKMVTSPGNGCRLQIDFPLKCLDSRNGVVNKFA